MIAGIVAAQLALGTATVALPITGSLVVTGYAPTITFSAVTGPQTGHLTVTGHAPALSRRLTVSPGTGSVVVTGHAPVLGASVRPAPSTGHVAVAGHAPALSYARTITGGTGHLALAGHQPTITQNAGIPFSSVMFLSGFEGTDGQTTFSDESSFHRTITRIAPAQISTAQFKIGSSSLLLDGTSGYLTAPDSGDFDFDGQFTVEAWFRPGTVSGNATHTIMSKRGNSANLGWELTFTAVSSAPGVGFIFSTDGFSNTYNVSSSSAGLLTVGTWYHLAATRDAANKIRLFLNGVMVASRASSTGTSFNNGSPFAIGATGNGNNKLNGYIDEARVIKGVAAYANDTGFTPSTSPFPRS
jgi:hypothetical protein